MHYNYVQLAHLHYYCAFRNRRCRRRVIINNTSTVVIDTITFVSVFWNEIFVIQRLLIIA